MPGNRGSRHPYADPGLWSLLSIALIVLLQVVLLQVALNRLVWGFYGEVIPPVIGSLLLVILSWFLYRRVPPA